MFGRLLFDIALEAIVAKYSLKRPVTTFTSVELVNGTCAPRVWLLNSSLGATS